MNMPMQYNAFSDEFFMTNNITNAVCYSQSSVINIIDAKNMSDLHINLMEC